MLSASTTSRGAQTEASRACPLPGRGSARSATRGPPSTASTAAGLRTTRRAVSPATRTRPASCRGDREASEAPPLGQLEEEDRRPVVVLGQHALVVVDHAELDRRLEQAMVQREKCAAVDPVEVVELPLRQPARLEAWAERRVGV